MVTNGLHVTSCYKGGEEKFRRGWQFGESKREKAGKLKVKKRNERGDSEEFGFIVFHFCLRECRERIL